MGDNLISVIIPVYNAKEYIGRCIDSVVNNSYRDIEIILVDDGSVDDSGTVCDAYAEADSRIRVIHQKNMGTAAARNAGLEIARGAYIGFADQDDFIHRDFYKIMYSQMVETNAQVILCDLTRDMDVQTFASADYTSIKAELVDKAAFIKDTYVSNWTRNTAPWNKLYKRELFQNIRFPEGKGYEDAYTTYRILFAADRIEYVKAPLYYWYQNPESYSSKKSNPRKLFFRQEAICQQAVFYTGKEYAEIAASARHFYLSQLFLMVWQLGNDYVQDEETIACTQKMKRLFRWYFYRHHHLCQSPTERFRYFELLHPVLGAQIRKYFCPNIYDKK